MAIDPDAIDVPYMNLWVSDFFGSTASMSREAAKSYLFILMNAWQMGGKFKNDERLIARMAGISFKAWKGQRDEIMPKLKDAGDGYLTQARLEHEFEKASSKRERLRTIGRKGGKAKKHSSPSPGKENFDSIGNGNIGKKSNDFNESDEAKGGQSLQPTNTNTIRRDSESPTSSESESTDSQNRTELLSAGADDPPIEKLNFPKFERLPKKGRRREYPIEFTSFWKVYPQRATDSAKSAYQAWVKPANDGEVGPRVLYVAARNYRAYIEQSADEPKLVATWVNAEGWTSASCRNPSDLFESSANASGISYEPAPAGIEYQHRPVNGSCSVQSFAETAARFMAGPRATD